MQHDHFRPPDLLVVMPVFNEQDCIQQVVTSWHDELIRHLTTFRLLVINDGATDQTPSILNSLAAELAPRLEIVHQSNRGHGQTCIAGYRAAIDRNIPFILQVDSDGQSDPIHFAAFWNARHEFDVIYGRRSRSDGFRRVFASSVLRLLLRAIAGADCVDANVPFRLMRTDRCADAIQSVPADFFLANIALSVVLRRDSTLCHGTVPISFPQRLGGEPSVPFSKFAAKGLELFIQLRKTGLI